MSEKVLITRSKVDNLADAIKDKTSSTSNLTLDEMKQKVEKELFYIEPIDVVENVVINPPSNGQITYTTLTLENVMSRDTYYIIVEGTTTWQSTAEYFYYAGEFSTPANNNYPISIPLEPILKSGSGTLHTLYLSLGVSKIGIAYLPDTDAQYCTSTLSIKYYKHKNVNLNNFYLTNDIVGINTYNIPINTTTLYAPLSTETQTYTGHGTAGYTEVTVPAIENEEFDAYMTGTLTSYNNSTISFIGSYGLAGCENLQSVSIPNCIKLSDSAFTNCINLQTIYAPNLSILAGYAFFNCYRLSSISFPNVSSLGYATFSNCSTLASVNFSLCESITSYAFHSCKNLSIINFPICKTVEQYAFQSTKITNLSLPSCTKINGFAFRYCSSLIQINLPQCSIIGNYAFGNCSSITEINLPLINIISSSAFFSNINLHTVSIGATCTIDNYAFRNCYNLVSLYLTGSSVCTLSNIDAFIQTPISNYTYSTNGVYGSIYVPASLLASYQAATNWATYSSRFVGI